MERPGSENFTGHRSYAKYCKRLTHRCTAEIHIILVLFIFLSQIICFVHTGFAQETTIVRTQKSAVKAPAVIDTAQVPDDELKERIRNVLAQIEDFKHVSIKVTNGVAQLTGEIARSETEDDLKRLVSRFKGVVYIDSKLKSTTDVGRRLTPVMDRVSEYGKRFLAQLPLILVAIITAALFWIVGKLVGRIAPRYIRLGINPMLKSLVSRLLTFVFVIVGLIIALDILDISALVGAVVGTAGIAGLAIGFAFKDIVENYLAGLLLGVRSLFSINDHVMIEDYEGRVVRLTSREIVIMTLDGNHVLIPNSKVFKSVIVNFTRNNLRRFDFMMGVGVLEDLEFCRRIGLDTLQAMKGVIDDPGPFTRIENIGDFAVNVRFFGWIDQRDADYFKVRSEAIRLVKQAFDGVGVDMPYPTHVQYTRSEAEEKPAAPVEEKRSAAVEAASADISVDRQLDQQIEEDLKTSEENNYLKDQAV